MEGYIMRIQPQNIEAEMLFLGAIFTNNHVIEDVLSVRPEDFYDTRNRLIYTSVLTLFHNSVAIDIITVANELRRIGKLEEAGNRDYIANLQAITPNANNIIDHAKIIKEKAKLRQIISFANDIAIKAYDGKIDSMEILSHAGNSLSDLSLTEKKSTYQNSQELMMNTIEEVSQIINSSNRLRGISSGFPAMDKVTSGLQKSDFIIVAARPSMGKTAFTLNIAANVAIRQNLPVAFFSLEMSAVQLGLRLLSSESMIKISDLAGETGGVSEKEEFGRLIQTANNISKAKLFIDDTSGLSILELVARARKLKEKEDIQLIIIDYVQLMSGLKKSENRQQEITEISRSLKSLARELDIPVIALSQLNRSVEMRQVKKPMLSDLRESGSLEQDADVVMFLYRDDYYNPETEHEGLTEINIAKHRKGAVDSFELQFKKDITRFIPVTYQKEEVPF